jgi:hypothetical protein
MMSTKQYPTWGPSGAEIAWGPPFRGDPKGGRGSRPGGGVLAHPVHCCLFGTRNENAAGRCRRHRRRLMPLPPPPLLPLPLLPLPPPLLPPSPYTASAAAAARPPRLPPSVAAAPHCRHRCRCRCRCHRVGWCSHACTGLVWSVCPRALRVGVLACTLGWCAPARRVGVCVSATLVDARVRRVGAQGGSTPRRLVCAPGLVHMHALRVGAHVGWCVCARMVGVVGVVGDGG